MSDWHETTVGDVITLQRGFDITRSKQRPGQVPVVSSGGISSYHDTPMATGPGVVIGRKGTLGKVFYLSSEYWPHDTTLWVKDFKGNHPSFVYYFLQTLNFLALDVGSSNPTLNRNHVHPKQIYWTSSKNQHAIATALGALDDKIAVNERIVTLYGHLLQTQFNHITTPELQQQEGISTPAKELVDFNPRTAKPKEEIAAYVDMSALPTDRAPITTWGHRKPKSGSKFVNGDTLLARITPCLENGKTGYVDFMGDGQVGMGSTEFIVMRSRAGVPQEFSYFLARNTNFRNHAIQKMTGTSGRQRVSAADASEFFIQKPTEEELKDFGDKSEKAFAHIKSLTSESRTLAELRDTLLPQLMSGKLRVKDAEKIVEDNV